MKFVRFRIPGIGDVMIEWHSENYGRRFFGAERTTSGVEAWAGRVCMGADAERWWWTLPLFAVGAIATLVSSLL